MRPPSRCRCGRCGWGRGGPSAPAGNTTSACPLASACSQVALAAANYDLVAARRTLRENGYSEVEVAPSPAASTARLSPPPGLPLPQPVPLPGPPQPVPLPGVAQAPSAPPAPLSLSEATYQRNQAIFEVGGGRVWFKGAWPCAAVLVAGCFIVICGGSLPDHHACPRHATIFRYGPPYSAQQERAHASRLQAAYRRCFALAQEKQAAGEHETAADLRMKVGH